MPIASHWVICKYCKHEASLFKVFGVSGADQTDLDRARAKTKDLKCTKCGLRGHAKIVDRTKKAAEHFYASANRTVFHRESCRWLGHTGMKDTLEFASRDGAMSAGFAPCKYCKP